jgi:hypothetical protein
VVSRRQLLELGIGAGAIKYRVAPGRLHRIHNGVYAVGHTVLGWQGRMMAAVLACGPDTLVSHRCAATVWGLRGVGGGPVHVIAPGRSRRGIVVHRARQLHDEDRAVRDGMPVTSLARTLLDLAEIGSRRDVERGIEEAERQRLFDLRAVERLLARSRGRRGQRALAAAMSDWLPDAELTRSELERHFLSLCRDAGLPLPAANATVEGHEVDAFWPNRRLVVELDSRAYHHTRAAFERDRVRDATLQIAGHRVLRVTHRRLEQEPAAVAEALRLLLGNEP